MIEIGGRTDVIVQWFSSRFVHDHHKWFNKTVAGPGEAVVFIENGKAEKIVTSDMCKTDLGLLGRLIDRLTGTDKQMIIADLNPKSVQIPFSGYTKDRTKISGNVNLTIRVNPNNLLRLMNLIRRDTVSDTKWLATDYAKDLKEICLEDIIRYMSYDTELIIDSTLLSQTMSSDIRDNFDSFNAKLRNAIDSMGFTWAASGISIDYARADISENAYEDSMRYIDELAKIQMKKDADFADREHEVELESNVKIAITKNAAREEMAVIVAEYDKQSFITAADNESELQQLEHNYSVIAADMRNKLAKAKGQQEIDRINGITEEEVARRKTDLEAYDMMEKTKVQEFVKNQDVDRTLKLMNAQRDIDIERAFEDGKKQGKALAEEEAYSRGRNEGFQDGYRTGMKEAATISKDAFGAAATGFSGKTYNANDVYGNPYSEVRCPKCGAINRFPYKFCNNCGKRPTED